MCMCLCVCNIESVIAANVPRKLGERERVSGIRYYAWVVQQEDNGKERIKRYEVRESFSPGRAEQDESVPDPGQCN